MKRWIVTAMVIATVLVGGCNNGGRALVRLAGANGLGMVAPGYEIATGSEAGLRMVWYEADAVAGDDETVAIGAYGAANIDPNMLDAFGLPRVEIPLGVTLKIGAFVLWDIEESNPIVGPTLILERAITENVAGGLMYDYQAFGSDLQESGYSDDHTVYGQMTFRF